MPQLCLDGLDQPPRGRLVGRFGGEAQVHAVGAGVDADAGVGGLELRAHHLVDRALADAGGLERARDQDGAGVAAQEFRRDLLLPHARHLRRRTRHRDDDLAVALDPPSGRGAARVGDGAGRGNDPALLDVALRHRVAALLEERAQGGLEVGVDARLLVEDRADRFARQVVLRRAEAAGADDDVGALARAADGLGQSIEVVADDGLEVDVDAERRQPGRDEGGVGIDDLAEQDLGADGEYLGLHGRSVTGGWRKDDLTPGPFPVREGELGCWRLEGGRRR